MDHKEILRLEDVSKVFELKNREQLRAVSDVSFVLKRGESVAIVGESGCGKSTLAKLVAYIENVSSGKIFFEGSEMTGISGKALREYRRQVQMIFQDPSNVFSPRMRIGTFLMEPWLNFEGKHRKEAKKAALYSLQRVGLGEEYMNKYPHQLSGGELQRVSIARAIALHPKLLICDEITSALDVSIQKQIIDLLYEHQKEVGFSILFICHDLALAEDFCDRVVVMYLGKVVEILEGCALKQCAKHPYTQALLASVFSVHDDPLSPIRILPGEPPSPINLPSGCAFCSRCRYAAERCRNEAPKLHELDGEHQVACHLYE